MNTELLEKFVINYLVYVNSMSIHEATEMYEKNEEHFVQVAECLGASFFEDLAIKIQLAQKLKTLNYKRRRT